MPQRYKFISAVHLILEKDGKTLLMRRFNTGYEDGKYGVVSGHIEANETARTAMVREAKEEAGIDIDENDLVVIHVTHRKGDDQERIDFFMKAKTWSGELVNMEQNKCDDLSWFEITRLPDNIIPYLKSAFEHIRKKSFYSEFGW